MDTAQSTPVEPVGAVAPLAERMRPVLLAEFVGQAHLVGENRVLYRAIRSDQLFSMILWGPPGVGKTTLARIMARETGNRFVHFSAVLSGIREIRAVIDETRKPEVGGKRTLLFVDEIHRFNKSQQDAFLPHVESGLITLIGATTQNPSFEVIPALMSRCRVLTLYRLTEEDLTMLIRRALRDPERGLGSTGVELEEDAVQGLAKMADGDARAALNLLETAVLISRASGESTAFLSLADVEAALEKKVLLYDKSGEEHYNLISAFHKSLRGSDPDAALYWLERMLAAGEDPLYVARRMVRFASEDVGNADPLALEMALNAMEAYRFLGSPEGDLSLAQAAVYLATAPKSNAVYTACGRVRQVIKDTGSLPVPLHIRNAPTSLMKEMGYGKDYRYAHDFPDAFVPQDHLPEKLLGNRFYHPSDRGYEKTIRDRLERWIARRTRGEPAKDGSR